MIIGKVDYKVNYDTPLNQGIIKGLQIHCCSLVS